MRTRGFAAVALCLAGAACGPRPPKGMTRLDSGTMNHGFAVDEGVKNLLYIDGTGNFLTSLVVVGLADGARRSYRFKDRRMVNLRPVPVEGAVGVVAAVTRYDDRFRRGSRRPVLLTVNTADGRLLSEDADSEDDTPPPPAAAANALSAAFAAAASGPLGAPPPDAVLMTAGSVSRYPKPGVHTAQDSKFRRSERFFPTPSEPGVLAQGAGARFYAAYRDDAGRSVLEEFDAGSGTRRVLARFDGEVESLTASGAGLVLLRREYRKPRVMTLVEAGDGRTALELPWADDSSRLLGADASRRRLYLVMREGAHETAWAVPLDPETLRAASEYLAAARAPKKITRGLVLIMWAGVIAVLFGLVFAVFGRGSGAVM